MRYNNALLLKRYLIENYGNKNCSVRIHTLSVDELKGYCKRGANICGVHALRIHIHLDDSIAEYPCIDKYSLKSMRSLMLDCKKGLY